jgi:hypothetical protein
MGSPSRYMLSNNEVAVLGTAIKKKPCVRHHTQTHCQNMLIMDYNLKCGKWHGKWVGAMPQSVHNELQYEV